MCGLIAKAINVVNVVGIKRLQMAKSGILRSASTYATCDILAVLGRHYPKVFDEMNRLSWEESDSELRENTMTMVPSEWMPMRMDQGMGARVRDF